MSDVPVERRIATKEPEPMIDGAYALAILYTVGFFGLVFALLFVNIPTNNREILLQLIGILSAAQLGIIKYFYDGSKGAEKVQQANIARSMKSEAVVQDIAKTAPITAAAAVAAATGNAAPIIPIPASADVINVAAQTANVTEAQPEKKE